MKTPRLDILLYAHDGRGLGHTSRSIGIGMALRRLYPSLSVLLVTGCRQAGNLIGDAPLDWLKLPSYETRVQGGRSRGINGKSGFKDQELAELRARTLLEIVRLYRPRLVLTDHQPQGKHRELLPALEAAEETTWVLGVRGVVGAVRQLQIDLAGDVFRIRYRALLWYGDSRVLGSTHLQQLEQRFGRRPVECGYVSRLSEFAPWYGQTDNRVPVLAGTISIPWLGEGGRELLAALADALRRTGPGQGPWRIFTDTGRNRIHRLFADIDHCSIEPPGPRYIRSLLNSRMAVIYGGYNSLVDVLTTGRPAVVLLRSMQDNEQRLHLDLLCAHNENTLLPVEEKHISPKVLTALLARQLRQPLNRHVNINLEGAEQAARQLAQLLA